MHYAIRAMGAMSLRISELCLSFSTSKYFVIKFEPHPRKCGIRSKLTKTSKHFVNVFLSKMTALMA